MCAAAVYSGIGFYGSQDPADDMKTEGGTPARNRDNTAN